MPIHTTTRDAVSDLEISFSIVGIILQALAAEVGMLAVLVAVLGLWMKYRKPRRQHEIHELEAHGSWVTIHYAVHFRRVRIILTVLVGVLASCNGH